MVDLQARRAPAIAAVPTEMPADVPAGLPVDRRPLPSVAPYDDLLKGAGSWPPVKAELRTAHRALGRIIAELERQNTAPAPAKT